MLNQTSVEALNSAAYIESYFDYVEHLPDEIQRCISRVRELDVAYNAFLKEIEQQQDVLHKDMDSTVKKKSVLVRVQQALIAAQEVGDEKLQILQQVHDLIENQSRSLESAYKNWAESGKVAELMDTSNASGNKETSSGHGTPSHVGGSGNVNSGGGNGSINVFGVPGSGGGSGGERQSKRVRRTRTDIPLSELAASIEAAANSEPIRQMPQQSPQSTPSSNTSSSSTQKKSGTQVGGTLNKKKKRKSKQGSQQQQQQQQLREQRDRAEREDSPLREDEVPIDPDEPTYCLCNQISYGEMIMCDNDLCPFEWFHFTCVSLITKPKGKWFCPRCRGDRSSIMKPKAQFMKELERYNKEKEMKDEKGS